MINLQWINPINLHDHWDTIKEGLEKVSVVGEGWIPEQVYMAIAQGQAYLHIAYHDESYAGFVITQNTQGYIGMTLHVWAVYSNMNDFDILGQCMPTFQEWANKIQAKKITFSSKRKGWSKMAEKLGFKPSVTFYEIEV